MIATGIPIPSPILAPALKATCDGVGTVEAVAVADVVVAELD